jgi:hypothetical protein
VWTFGLKITSADGTDELLSYYPPSVKDWISRNGGLTLELKRVRNGPELWEMISPCPEEF